MNDIYLAGFGATKLMVYGVICALKEAEQREAPSEQWFRGWLLKNKDTIKTTRTKVIPRSRVTAQDEKDIEAWFVEYKQFVHKMGIKRVDIWNFDETGFQIGVTCGEDILVLVYISTLGCRFMKNHYKRVHCTWSLSYIRVK